MSFWKNYTAKIALFRIGLAALALCACAANPLPLCAKGAPEERPFRFALLGSPDTLDPHKTAGTLTFQVLKSIYDTLVEPDEKGAIVPALAESWTISGDGRLWTFHLRGGVVFHNGETLTSRDVKASLDRMRNPLTANPQAHEYAAITDTRTPDERTLELVLSGPSAPLLAALASGWSAILPASLIEKGHDFASHPVGTGPFVFGQWLRDNKVSLKKNPSYWMPGLPKISALEFRVIPERAVQVQGLLTGELDAAELYDAGDAALLEKSSTAKIEKGLSSFVQVVAINTSRPPLSDPRVRQALNHAVDRQKILDIAYGGGSPIGTFMDSGDPYYKDFTGLYPYDPEKAANLIREAAPSFEKPLEIAVPQNFEYHVRASQLYKEMFAKAGIPTTIRLVDWSTWLSEIYGKSNFDLTVIAHTGKLDPDLRLANYGREKNYVRWTNAENSKLLAQART
ncbi:MAG: ABC transporter substrate-binding protein, partial [Spirochaetales bacterium]|nr:ABC transporter substrate-binding protein [Spirochaetales bacterium]